LQRQQPGLPSTSELDSFTVTAAAAAAAGGHGPGCGPDTAVQAMGTAKCQQGQVHAGQPQALDPLVQTQGADGAMGNRPHVATGAQDSVAGASVPAFAAGRAGVGAMTAAAAGLLQAPLPPGHPSHQTGADDQGEQQVGHEWRELVHGPQLPTSEDWVQELLQAPDPLQSHAQRAPDIPAAGVPP
jgi:hypothetical protein